MSPDELARELEDLQRFSPPLADPVALLDRDTRIRDLEQENSEFRQLASSRAAELASLSRDSDRQKRELASLRSAHDTLLQEQKLHELELRFQGQSWTRSALEERSAKRTFSLDLCRRRLPFPRFCRRGNRGQALVLHPRRPPPDAPGRHPRTRPSH